jgi:DNA-directed RNA polymerase specialized sigma24 family protein
MADDGDHERYTQRLSKKIDAAFVAYTPDDDESATRLYKAFRAQARNVIANHPGLTENELAHDIAQRGMMGLKGFRGESRVSTWFYIIAQREVDRALRAHIETRATMVPIVFPG